jgi:hypothetical protein
VAGDRQFYLERAYKKAFGQFDEPQWDPKKGFAANEPRILKLYDYYRDTYLARPDLFLWAGLGRMAGGAVVGGLQFYVAHAHESVFTQKMVQIGKEIFHDLAWQHEAILDDESNALKLAAERDATSPARRNYREAWAHILSGDEARIATGNKMLLENEQFTIIQPLYNQIAGTYEGLGDMLCVRAFTSRIHPYHRDFLISLQTKDVIKEEDRWAWITETGGMWEKWAEKRGVPAWPIAMSKRVRTNLVTLKMQVLIDRKWPVEDQSLLPPGAVNSEEI